MSFYKNRKELDLLLVKPGDKKEIYGGLDSFSLTAIEPPVWTGLIAGFVRARGYSVWIIDAEAENLSPDNAADNVIKSNPLLVCITVTGSNLSASTWNMPGAKAFINSLKAKNPKIQTILWGLHPSALPEQTLRETNADFVCQGEGFYTIVELLKTLKISPKTENLNIDGLWYLQNNDVVANSHPPLIKNLDDLPFTAWDLLPMEKYRAHNWHCFADIGHRQPYAVIFTSLGCPFNCTFCNVKALFGARGVRYRSPENVIDEIDLLVKKYHVKNIKILDECFTLNETHVIDLSNLIINRGYELNCWVYSRIDTNKEKMLKKMKAAGINWVAYGIESGSKNVRNGLAKGRFSQELIKEVIKKTKAAGINVCGNFMFGLPDDDFGTMQETLDLAKELNCEYTNFYVTMAYPGSQLYEDAVRRNIKLPETWLGYAQLSEETVPLPTKYLSSADVLRFRDRAFEEFYSSPKYINMITKKFGQKIAEHIQEMRTYKIHRKLLEAEI